MTEEDAHKAIFARFIEQWPLKVGGTQSAPTVPYTIDNRAFANPTSGPFAVVSIQNLDGDQATMGREGFRRFERRGWIDVKLYDEPNRGRGRTDELAKFVIQIFEAKTIGLIPTHKGIRTYTTNCAPVKNDKEYPGLWCYLCRTGYEFHERR